MKRQWVCEKTFLTSKLFETIVHEIHVILFEQTKHKFRRLNNHLWPMTGTYFFKRKNQKLFASEGGINRSESPLHPREQSFQYLFLNLILKFIFFLDTRKTLCSHIPSSSFPPSCVATDSFFLRNVRNKNIRIMPKNNNNIVISWALRRCQALSLSGVDHHHT